MEPPKGSSFGSANTTSSTKITSGLQCGRAKIQKHQRYLNKSGRPQEVTLFYVADEATCAETSHQGIASRKNKYSISLRIKAGKTVTEYWGTPHSHITCGATKLLDRNIRSYAGKKFPENEMVMPDKYLHYDQKKELRRTGLGRGPKGSNKVLN
ncbi:hypothetical protein PCH_Pc12g08330 [Penicillium rubens Wisconsin 54-1255]|uniref:Uncharacterized protein n=1 Tax=Penicillium rubens (strain ATCC 28089 / DSM 1075 / NRRL 1951 / Wisconsin 54-1255) TaxID=500485 RepID=B6GY02_PENRW|nr:hypothetical protein PCH_Pc12g08330 [Penicillium rubens Wisconsin 54-1255]